MGWVLSKDQTLTIDELLRFIESVHPNDRNALRHELRGLAMQALTVKRVMDAHPEMHVMLTPKWEALSAEWRKTFPAREWEAEKQLFKVLSLAELRKLGVIR